MCMYVHAKKNQNQSQRYKNNVGQPVAATATAIRSTITTTIYAGN